MSVPDQETSYFYTGNGVTTTFAYGFYLLALADIKVSLNGVEQSTGFTVNGIGSQTGGAVIFATAPANGISVLIERDVAIKRDTDYQPNGDLRSDVLNTDFDRIWMALQDKKRENVRSLRYPNFENLDGLLPNAASRANMVLGFSANGVHTMLPIPASFGAGNLITDVFASGVDFTPGVTTQLILSRDPGTKDNVQIFFDGVFQGPDQFGLSGTTITFNEPIRDGVTTVFARIGTTLSISTPPSKSVGDSELQWGDVLGRVVSSIADLKTLAKITYTRAFVVGYYANGDGGGGAYWLDTSDTTSVDNGGTIIVADDGGRWKLQLTGPVSVKQFGAKGDGIANDSAAFQNWINWLNPYGHGYVPKTTAGYRLVTTINVPPASGEDSGIKIDGIGVGSLIKPGAAMTTMFNVTGKNFQMEGLCFSNVAASATTAVTLTTDPLDAGLSARCDRNYVVGFTNGFSFSGQNYTFRDNWCQNNQNHIKCTNDGRNSSFIDNYLLGGNNGYVFQKTSHQAEGVLIQGGKILVTVGSGAGITLTAGLSIKIHGLTIDQTGPNSPGIYMPVGVGDAVAKVTISDSWIAGGQNSYSIFGSGNIADLAVDGCDIMSNNGLALAAGISLNGTNGFKLRDNNFGVVSGNDLSLVGVSNYEKGGNTSSQGSGSNAIGFYSDFDIASNGKITAGLFEVIGGGPKIFSGTVNPNGNPTYSAPEGSLFLRGGGGVGGRLYVCGGGTVWAPVAGV